MNWWPWRRRPPVAAPAPSGDVAEAALARREAEAALAHTHQQTAEVRELAERLRQHRRVNHFAELFGQSLGGRP